MNAIILFDIINAIVSLFRNGFIRPLEYQSTIKLGQKSNPEQSVEEGTKLGTQRFDEIAQQEKTLDLELFRYYFKYSSSSDMYKN